MNRLKTNLTLLALLLVAPRAAEAASEYSQDVAPILRKYCASCHNADDREGELSLLSFADLSRGGERGPVIVPGQPDASRLIRVLTGQEEPKMPPEDQVGPSPEEIAQLRVWIEQGALPPQRSLQPRPQPVIAPSTEPLAGITAVAAAPDGSEYALGYFQRIEIIDAASGVVRKTIAGQPGKVTALHYSPSGQQLVVASGVVGTSGQASLWNTSDGELLREFAGHQDILYDAELSPDGELLATCSYDRKVHLWSTSSGEILRTLAGHNDAVYDVAFSPDGTVLASASGDETVKLWLVATGLRLDTLSQPQAEQYVVAFSPDGQHILAGGADNRIRAWHFQSRTKQRINPIAVARFAHEGAVVALAFTNDGRQLVSAAADKSLKQWDAATLQQTHRFQSGSDQTSGLAILSNTAEVLVSQLDGKLLRLPLAPPLTTAVDPATPEDVSTSVAAASINHLAEHEPNGGPDTAMRVYLPAKIEGNISAAEDADFFRFSSTARQEWVLEVKAARDESQLDSVIEVLDSKGQPVPRVLLQATRDSYFTFRGKDSSTSDDFRLHNWQEMELNEFLYANGEVVKLWHYPRGPDSGFQVYPGRGKRYGFFDTTAMSHALQAPCYIVKPRPASSPPASNGLPAFTLYYENDDDSRRELGADSRLTFRAPRDGEFVVRIGDIRGFGGPDFHYAMTIRPRNPDFKLTVSGGDAELSRGSGKEFSVVAQRIDEFDDEIRIDVENLPEGFHASTPLVIEAGQEVAVGAIHADSTAIAPSSDSAAAATLTAIAIIQGRRVVKPPLSFGTLALSEKAELEARVVAADAGENWSADADRPFELTIAPGETITAKVRIKRNGFEGRVEFGTSDAGRNLPHGVFVDNIGLNGLLIVEGQEERTFFITAAEWVPETSRVFHLRAVSAENITTRPVLLHIRHPNIIAASSGS